MKITVVDPRSVATAFKYAMIITRFHRDVEYAKSHSLIQRRRAMFLYDPTKETSFERWSGKFARKHSSLISDALTKYIETSLKPRIEAEGFQLTCSGTYGANFCLTYTPPGLVGEDNRYSRQATLENRVMHNRGNRNTVMTFQRYDRKFHFTLHDGQTLHNFNYNLENASAYILRGDGATFETYRRLAEGIADLDGVISCIEADATSLLTKRKEVDEGR